MCHMYGMQHKLPSEFYSSRMVMALGGEAELRSVWTPTPLGRAREGARPHRS
jgi:hypothetical protein